MAKEIMTKGFEIELKRLRVSLLKAEKAIRDFNVSYNKCSDNLDKLLNKESSTN